MSYRGGGQQYRGGGGGYQGGGGGNRGRNDGYYNNQGGYQGGGGGGGRNQGNRGNNWNQGGGNYYDQNNNNQQRYNDRAGGGWGNQGGGGGGRGQGGNLRAEDVILSDLDLKNAAHELPQWPFSSYSWERHSAHRDLTGDASFEEVRWKQMQGGKPDFAINSDFNNATAAKLKEIKALIQRAQQRKSLPSQGGPPIHEPNPWLEEITQGYAPGLFGAAQTTAALPTTQWGGIQQPVQQPQQPFASAFPPAPATTQNPFAPLTAAPAATFAAQPAFPPAPAPQSGGGPWGGLGGAQSTNPFQPAPASNPFQPGPASNPFQPAAPANVFSGAGQTTFTSSAGFSSAFTATTQPPGQGLFSPSPSAGPPGSSSLGTGAAQQQSPGSVTGAGAGADDYTQATYTRGKIPDAPPPSVLCQ